MLLSDLHRMDSYLSSILRSHQEDMEMTLSDDAASETSEHSDPMADIEKSMRPLCAQFKLQDEGEVYRTPAREYTLYIKPKNEWYNITIGWNVPVEYEFMTFAYTISSENGYEDGYSDFALSSVINALTTQLEDITQGTLQPVEEEDGDQANSPGEEKETNEEDMMDDIEDGINYLDIGPAKSDRHKPKSGS